LDVEECLAVTFADKWGILGKKVALQAIVEAREKLNARQTGPT
jgi:hypothetical protein